jgi:hypothetical protein
MGLIDDDHYDPSDVCGSPNCLHAARAAVQKERDAAYARLDELTIDPEVGGAEWAKKLKALTPEQIATYRRWLRSPEAVRKLAFLTPVVGFDVADVLNRAIDAIEESDDGRFDRDRMD